MSDKTASFFDFSGGFNDTAPSESLPSNTALEARNWNLVPGGGLQKRSGSAKLNSSTLNSSATFTALAGFRPSSGSNFLVGIAGDVIARMDTMDGTWDDISAALTITAGDNNVFTTTFAKDLIILANGINATIKYSGSGDAAVLGGSPPTARSVLYVNRHLVHARDTTNKLRVQFSDLDDPESYTSTRFIDFATEPTALGTLNNNLYVFENFRISMLPIVVWPFAIAQEIIGIGCVGHRAIVNVEDSVLMFMTSAGKIYVFDGSTLTDVSSGRIDTELAGMNKARRQFVVMDHFKKKRQVWISYSSGSNTQNNRILVYDYTKGITSGAWMIFTNINANVLASVIEQRTSGEGDETMLTGDYAGFCREQDNGSTDDEQADGIIDAFWSFGFSDFGSLESLKNIRFASIVADENGGTVLDFMVGYDGDVGFTTSKSFELTGPGGKFGTSTFGSSVFGGGGLPNKPKFLHIPGRGLYVKVGFRCNKASQPVNLLRGANLFYDVLGFRVGETVG